MNNIEVALVMLGAFWAGTSALFSGVQFVANTRNKITLGVIDGEKLTESQRFNILHWDWVPMQLSLASISLVLGIIIASLPALADTGTNSNSSLQFICIVTAIIPFSGFATFFGTGIAQYLSLRKSIPDTSPCDDADRR